MRLFFWKHTQHIDTFAKNLADELYSQMQPAAANAYFGVVADPVTLSQTGVLVDDRSTTISRKKSGGRHSTPKKKKRAADQKHDDRIERLLGELILKVRQFKVNYNVGVYGKAKLHLVFMERLKELGYNPDVARQLNQIILLQTR